METIYNIILDFIPLLGIFSFIKAIIEYRKSQLWKESEFLSKEVKEFFSDDRVKVVLTLLDWNARKIMINDQEVKVNDAYMIEALKTHNQRSRFSIEEAYLRDLFDNFFDKLAYFNIHCKNGLVSEEKIFNYFSYYFNILTTTERKDVDFLRSINNYIDYYDYTNVRELLDKFKNRKRDH
jgi:hypothetical protein